MKRLFPHLIFHSILPLSLMVPTMAAAGPTVVPTAEGQLGEAPAPGDQVLGARFEPLPGSGDVLLGGLFVFGGMMPPPLEFSFLTDQLIEPSTPAPVSGFPGSSGTVDRLAPRSASSVGLGGDDVVAFSFALDGSMPNTMSVRIATFDETGSSLVDVEIANVDTFAFPDPGAADTGVAVDDQGRVTVVYTEFPVNLSLPPPFQNDPPRVRARRFDAMGNPIGGEIPVAGDPRAYPDVALLDPAGNRLIVPNVNFIDSGIHGNIIDTAGPAPVVLPEFPISTTPGFGNLNPAVTADPATGAFTVAWEHINEAVPVTNPTDIRARRFDAMGNPVGDDFVVNSNVPGDQGQPASGFGPNGESVIVWAGVDVDLDVFGQVYDASGQPIGGEFRVNSVTAGEQSRPAVRFLPGPDAQGRPQFAVVWRDVVGSGNTTPNGTGTGFRCFSIETGDPAEIFADGFESGDTSSWSCAQP